MESWLEVKKLGISFPNLESLVLSQCPLRSLDSSCSSVSNECKSSLYSRSESESESSGWLIISISQIVNDVLKRTVMAPRPFHFTRGNIN